MRQAQASLADQEQRYHDIQNATDMIQSVAPDGRFLFVNRKWQDTLGYKESELKDINLFEIIHEESREHCMALFPRVMAGEDVGIIDVIFKARNGRKVYAEGFASCKIVEGKPEYTRGIFKDVTERKKAADDLKSAYVKVTAAEEELRANYEELHRQGQALKESEEKFRTLVEYTLDGILILDYMGKILFANHAAGQIIEKEDIREVIGVKNVMEYLDPESQADAIRDFSKVAQGTDGYLAQYKVITTQQQVRWVESIGKRITFGGREAILISLRDITDRKKGEQDLLKKNEELNTALEELTAKEEELRANYEELGRQGQDLRASEEKYRLLTETTNDIIYTIDVKGIITHVSPQIGRYGYTQQEVISQHFTKFFVEEDLAKVIGDVGKVLSTKQAVITLLRARDKSGNVFWMESSGAPVIDNSGSVVAVSGIMRDVTERKMAEDALRESEEKFRALVENSLEGIFIVDFLGNLLFANRAAGRIIDAADVGAIIGKRNVLEFVAPECQAEVIRDFSQVMQGIDAYLVQYKLITESRREIWVECIGKKIPFKGSSAMLVSMRDVTERKRSEAAMRESEIRFATIFRSSPVALTLVSAAEGTFVDVNDTFLRNTGYTRDEVLGKTSAEVGIFADREEYEQMVTSLRNQQTIYGKELQCRIRSGEIRTCLFTSGIVLMEGTPHILSTVEDITGRKSAEMALQAMVKSMVGTTGLDSLKKITENVSSWLGADCVMIGEIQADNNTVKVLSMILDGKEVTDFSYKLKDTPCEKAAEKGFCMYLDDAAQLFPKAKDLSELNIRGYVGTSLRNSEGETIGILCVLTRRPLRPPPGIQETMEIIAVKAAAEIERARIEHTLLESEEKFRTLVETTSDFIWEVDANGTYTYVSPKAYDLLGYLPSEMVGKTPFDYMTPVEAEKVGAEFGRLKESQVPISTLENQCIHKNGSVVVLETSGVPKYEKDGSFAGYRGIDRDITERKRVQEALSESEEKFRTLVEHSLDGILIVDPAGIVLFRNRAAAAIVETENRSGQSGPINALEYIAPEARGRLLRDLSLAAQGSDSYPVNYPAITATGRRIWIEAIGKRILYRNSPAILVSLRDITSRKQMEEAILRTNKQLSLLSSITRHDVLNKISVIDGHIALARKRGPAEDYPALLDKIAATTRIIRSQAEFTRVYQSLGVKEPEWQNLKKIFAAPHIPDSVTFRNELPNIEIFADLMLEKVFQNLTDNTLLHGGKVTEIRVHSRTGPDGLTILFEDNGIGIPAEEKEKIFARGYGKNTGLGLFLAREILGITAITIRETGESGNGARFEILVPAGAFRFVPAQA